MTDDERERDELKRSAVNISPECRAKLDVLRKQFEIPPTWAALVEWLVDRELARRELTREK